uniref:Uncharacterized protein n=1 Tax=Cajanus cajan TaxID=3821 RepID=A0A151UE83_CAJCA
MANTIQPSFIPIPIFNGENYDFWSTKMKTYFTFQDLWDTLEEGFSTPEDTSSLTTAQKKELKENKQKNSKVLFILQQVVIDPIFPRIMGATIAKEAWTTLQEEFEGSEKVRAVKLQTLRRNFELLNMKEQNKENRNNGETSRNKENSRNFSRNYQNEYPPCGICKRKNHAEKDCRYRGKP